MAKNSRQAILFSPEKQKRSGGFQRKNIFNACLLYLNEKHYICARFSKTGVFIKKRAVFGSF